MRRPKRGRSRMRANCSASANPPSAGRSARSSRPAGAAVPPPCARSHSDRAGRDAVSHRPDVVKKLDATRMRLIDSRERPHGELRVTTTVGIGTNWLTPRLGEFLELYPDIKLNVLLSDDELDLAMREADVAIRVREPMQPDLIRRRLFTMHFHAYASSVSEALRPAQDARGPRQAPDPDLRRLGAKLSRQHQFAAFCWARSEEPSPPTCPSTTSPRCAGRSRTASASPSCRTIWCSPTRARAYPAAGRHAGDRCYLVYAEEMKNVARVRVFRDFLVSNAQRWDY